MTPIDIATARANTNYSTTEPLPDVVKIWVLKHPSYGYLTRSGWSTKLQNARKWNRRSDASLCKNTSYMEDIEGSIPTGISFTHGFQRVS